jgi:3-hydroxybutyryl-CoA dehydrogenase
MNGHEVIVRDTGQAELDRARGAIDKSLARFVKAGKTSEEDAAATLERLAFTEDLRAVVQDRELVIEAVPEILDLKHDVFAKVVEFAPATALLASNTSQLSITAIAAPLGDAGARFIGMHFFNPPVMMKLVELIRGLQTSDETVATARAFGESLGKQVVVCQKDSPGFITSRAYAALRLECLRRGHRHCTEAGIQPSDGPAGARRLQRARHVPARDDGPRARARRALPADRRDPEHGRSRETRPKDRPWLLPV